MWQHAVHQEYLEDVLKIGKMLSVKPCTLLTLNVSHLGYVRKAEGPSTYDQSAGGGHVGDGSFPASAQLAVFDFETKFTAEIHAVHK